MSIIIPVFNGGNYLKGAINSALEQDYKNIEVLVINDGSNDSGETEAIAKGYGERVRYFYKPNGGVASALNHGLSHMEGEYFSWLSHDDLYFKNKISKQIAFIRSIRESDAIVFSGFDVIDTKGRKLNTIVPLERHTKERLETSLFALLYGMISGCSLLIHKSHFERVGLFREDLPTTQDFDLWFRMMRHCKCRVCPGVLHAVRVHGGQGSRILKAIHREESDRLWIRIMNELSTEEKILINGSVEEFYKDIYRMLIKYTKNRKAILYAWHQALPHRNRAISNAQIHIIYLMTIVVGFARFAKQFIFTRFQREGIPNENCSR